MSTQPREKCHFTAELYPVSYAGRVCVSAGRTRELVDVAVTKCVTFFEGISRLVVNQYGSFISALIRFGIHWFSSPSIHGASTRLHSEEEAASPSSEETPLEAAIALKNRGNRNFKAGRYEKAVECYTEALEQCPPTAVEERATFFQNRAAARENLRQLEAAVEDCNAALELAPTYLKALNRRARLYERLNDLSRWLFDVTACCLLERFQNSFSEPRTAAIILGLDHGSGVKPLLRSSTLFFLSVYPHPLLTSKELEQENVLCMDRVLKQIGQKLAKEEPPKLPRTLPSPDFIKFYFSSWAYNPFTLEAMTIGKKPSANAEQATNGLDEAVEEEKSEKAEEVFNLPRKLASAYEQLEKAFEKLHAGEYEASWELVETAVKDFNSAATVDLHAFEKSRFGDREKPESARARALLLDTTFKALSGDAEEAKSRFLSIGETLFAHPTIRVNALIKAGALYMTIDKDLSGCMYCFQQAQTLSPDCPDVYLHRGQINLLAENLDAAEKDLCEAAQWLYLLYRKSESDGKSQRVEELVKQFQKLVEKFPNCVETHSLYAQILTERGEFQKSDEEFARIIELSPNSGLAYSHRGLLQLRWKQDQDAADEWFRRAIDVDPRCELAWELRGQLAMERGELEKAEGYFQRALDEARTSQDRGHLFALREGVRAQIHAAKVYGISIASLFADLKGDFQQKIAAAGGLPVSV
ncbi:Mitochondrial import receptor subunit TOM70 [Echinococcus granulosus]|uniref:Mitochondrial import receptor subunit TOM70 n=1 Tax=Echinococcus granulosus TaxID=6210 RepID=W6U303_ECHGR|nr:Mitochondrial import receptor subunit TOM70 [Echinococcus granulosus]EUB55490.1 Mitochondrial import receptor subunit TOM70 [Echinococcus granulosus]